LNNLKWRILELSLLIENWNYCVWTCIMFLCPPLSTACALSGGLIKFSYSKKRNYLLIFFLNLNTLPTFLSIYRSIFYEHIILRVEIDCDLTFHHLGHDIICCVIFCFFLLAERTQFGFSIVIAECCNWCELFNF
jgi:hypothetical protein